MNGALDYMQFAGLFFTWWGFFLGAIVGGTIAFIVSLYIAPVLYRVKRRRDLRRMWRANEIRDLAESLMPSWAEYNPDDETVDHKCVCHGRKVYAGENVLLWPEIGPMGILHTSVYCESVKESV